MRPWPAVTSVADSESQLPIAKAGGLIARTTRALTSFEATRSEHQIVNIETPQPGMAERAVDTATDVTRTITQASAALQAAVDRLSAAITAARRPGQPLSIVSAITREAPLASLFVAFLLGVAIARRH